MDDRTDLIVDTLVALGLIGLCALVLVESLHIPHTAFDALGSARVPQAAAGIVAALSFVVLGRSLARLRTAARQRKSVSARRWADALVIFLISVAFVAAMQNEVMAFGPLATIYLVLAIGWLERFKLKRMPVTACLSIVVGFGCAYVFTKIFIVNLPGL